MLIDMHCHFDMMSRPEKYIRQRELAGDIVIGMTNLPSHFSMGFPHIKSFKHVRLALGMHPLLAGERREELPLFGQLVDKTCYVGEIGLDFSRDGFATKVAQMDALHEMLYALSGKNKIVSVHSKRAEKELLGLLRDYGIQNVIFHWYSGPVELIPDILAQGYYFSINEAMTLSRNGRAIIARIPRERMLTESDAPYNEKSDIRKVLVALGITDGEVRVNFKRLVEGARSRTTLRTGL